MDERKIHCVLYSKMFCYTSAEGQDQASQKGKKINDYTENKGFCVKLNF
jgi:hypothetical protein